MSNTLWIKISDIEKEMFAKGLNLHYMSNNLWIRITDIEKEMFAKGRTYVNLFTQLHCCRQFGRTYSELSCFQTLLTTGNPLI